MKILYIGCVKSSKVFLKAILDNTNAEIIGIVTKVNSNYNADHEPLNEIAEEYGIDWIDYKNPQQLVDWTHLKQPDIIYCFGWSHLLPKEVFKYPKLGAIGYHPTLLPKNRGRHPIIWTIVLGLKETGSTFFYLDEKPDSGDIISQEIVKVDEYETASSLYEKLLRVGKKQIIQVTKDLMNQEFKRTKQDESQATYWRKRSKSDGLIDWRMSAKSIFRLVNALSKPYVGAHFVYNDSEIKVWKAEILSDVEIESNIEPGKIVSVDKNSFTVKTGDSYIRVIDYEGDFVPKKGDYL